MDLPQPQTTVRPKATLNLLCTDKVKVEKVKEEGGEGGGQRKKKGSEILFVWMFGCLCGFSVRDSLDSSCSPFSCFPCNCACSSHSGLAPVRDLFLWWWRGTCNAAQITGKRFYFFELLVHLKVKMLNYKIHIGCRVESNVVNLCEMANGKSRK